MLRSTLVLALLAAFQATARPPTFSGTWSLDPSKSLLVEGSSQDIELVVDERPTSVAVTQRTPRSQEKYSGTLDGTPREEREPSSIYVRTLRRENGALLWQVKMTRVADQASISFSERWTLSSDGNTLTIVRNYPGPRQVLKVFLRKK